MFAWRSVRIRLNADPDPAIYLNADLDMDLVHFFKFYFSIFVHNTNQFYSSSQAVKNKLYNDDQKLVLKLWNRISEEKV